MDQCTDACGDYSGWDKIYDQGSIEIRGDAIYKKTVNSPT